MVRVAIHFLHRFLSLRKIVSRATAFVRRWGIGRDVSINGRLENGTGPLRLAARNFSRLIVHPGTNFLYTRVGKGDPAFFATGNGYKAGIGFPYL